MIFSFDGSVAIDGYNSEIGTDLMNALRTFVYTMPEDYISVFIPQLIKDLANPQSFIYRANIDDIDTYWFEELGLVSEEQEENG